MNLDLVWQLSRRIAGLQIEIATFHEFAEFSGQISLAEKCANYIAVREEQVEKLSAEKAQAKRELSDKLSCDSEIPPVVKTIFLLRYVDCLLWRVIAKKMCYSLRNIFRYHRIWKEKLERK